MGFVIFLLVVIVFLLLYLLFTYRKEAQELREREKLLTKELGTIKSADEYYNAKKYESDKLQNSIEDLKRQKGILIQENSLLTNKNYVESVFVEDYDELKSDEIKNKLELLRNTQKNMVSSGEALIVSNTTDKKSVVNAQKKQILRCFNSETVSIIKNATAKNVNSSRGKITRAFESINKMFKVDGVEISQKYLETKYDELSLVYAYMLRVEEEAEQRRAIREQLVEEEKARRDYERAKQQIEKDQKQCQNEVNKLMKYMQQSHDDVERQLYIDKIKELEEKLNKLEEDKKDVINREQNAKAGFVYIISNIGSFGENVYKIGMTRRLEPMDRIKELSSASVPFVFDVHALIFSEDAPGLENTLHQYFDSKRVNKINLRKEFFNVDLGEIKKVVLENHNATVTFVDVPDAIEYRESVKKGLKLARDNTPMEVIKETPKLEPKVKSKVQPVKVKAQVRPKKVIKTDIQ